MAVKNIRFTSGENVICELNEEKEDSIVIADAIIAMPAGEDGTQIGFAPWAPLQDPDIHELEINKIISFHIHPTHSVLMRRDLIS